MRCGADTYGPYNWRKKKVSTMAYVSAAMRHLLSYLDGEDLAPDSRCSHLGHALACLGILCDATECQCLIDDRPPKGAAANILKRYTRER